MSSPDASPTKASPAASAATHWRQLGKEPDYRFSLANERTFLAWIRTALALLAGGVLLDQFASTLQLRSVLVGLAVALSLLSALLAAGAYQRWKINEIAMRHDRALPGSLMLPLLSAGMLLVAVVLAVLLYILVGH